jgi:hypothetical protein
MNAKTRRLVEEIELAAQFYRHGLSIYSLADVYEVQSETVRRHLIAAGVQMRKREKMITAFGETKCLADWARDPRCKVSLEALQQRIRAGWNPQAAITLGPIECDGSPRKPR